MSMITTNDTLNIPPAVINAVETVFLVFWIITVPFYFFLLFFLIRAQFKQVSDLANPFFKFCITSSIIDLTNMLNNYIFGVFPKWGWFPDFYLSLGVFFPYFFLYFAWSLGICQAMSTSVLATNRLSAILVPEKYQRFWNKKRVYIGYSLQFAIGLSIALSVLQSKVHIEKSASGSLVPKFSDPARVSMFFFIGAFFLGINSIYLVFAYCYLLITLRKRHKVQIRSQGTDRAVKTARRREIRLFTMSTITVAVQLIIVFFFSVKIFPIAKLTLVEFYMFYNALSDFYSGINPYLLWIFSDALRDYVYQYLKLVKKEVVTVSSISINISN